MDYRKAPRSDDDLPIIGDYSEAQNARLRAETPSALAPEPPPPGPPPRDDGRRRDERWVLDPSDVQRHARIARQRKGARRFGKLRGVAWAAVVVAVGAVVYWKLDTLRGISVDFSELKSFLGGDAPTGTDASRSGSAQQSASVESQAVAGVEVATSRSDKPITAAPASSERPLAVPAATERPPARREAPVQEDAPAPAVAADAGSVGEQVAAVVPPAPPAPPEPETFAFALPVNTVSESDAATAILVVRSGGTRGASSVIWWTTPGTATPGSDYVDQGRVVEKFAPGEQNRTIRIPIVGDNVVEGPENFYVHLATSSGGEETEIGQAEVVINDDD
jgi:hypothetical protein